MKKLKFKLLLFVFCSAVFCSCEKEQSDIQLETSTAQESIEDKDTKEIECELDSFIQGMGYKLEVVNMNDEKKTYRFLREDLVKGGRYETFVEITNSLDELFPSAFLEPGVKRFRLKSSAKIKRSAIISSEAAFKTGDFSTDSFFFNHEPRSKDERINSRVKIPNELAKKDLVFTFEILPFDCQG